METVEVIEDKDLELSGPVKRNVALHFFSALKLTLNPNDNVSMGGKIIGKYKGLKGFKNKFGTNYEVIFVANSDQNMSEFKKIMDNKKNISVGGSVV